MTASASSASAASRLSRLSSFLDQDPNNLQIIADAAATALDAGEPAQTMALLDRYAGLSALPATLCNLRGLAAIQGQQFSEAARLFDDLLADNSNDPVLRFNRAWCAAMLQDFETTSSLLDETAATQSPRAASLKVQALHHLGRLEEALAWGQRLAERYPDDAALAGALAAVAIDAEDLALAERYAIRAGDQHDGLAALGMLRLNRNQIDESLWLFDRALDGYAEDARAQLGKGLALLAKGEPNAAADHIDSAARLFGGHLGSWVAAGWAYFVKGDYAASRARFEAALAIDDTFAEIHGGLAVLDVVEGRMDDAKRRTDIALRLDRNCFSAALAKMLILSGQGQTRAAERVRDLALGTPIDAGGRTLAQVMVEMGLTARKPSN